jgi:SAM-dependent methyltransferase
LKGNCHIIGGDVSDELLEKAKNENEVRGTEITFINLDFDKEFPFPDNSFDLLTCCFAIYYAKDVCFTISEMFRVLKRKGRLFVTGPMPENKKVFYSIIKEATNNQIPPMPSSSRYSSEILDVIKNKFSKTEIYMFENPLIFKEAEPFVDYTKASLSEDRKLWSNIFVDESFNQIIDKIANVSKKMVEKDGQIIMAKVVGGFIAYKLEE